MYEIFEQLLQKNGITTYKVSKDTGISQTIFSNWKSGRSVPKQDKMERIADYFGVSLEYLRTGREKEGEQYYLNEETAKMAQQIFENRELKSLFKTAADAPPEDLEAAHNILLVLKRKERGIDD